MGWKRVKEHFRITHIVQVTEAGICVGSPYIHDIVVISLEGKVLKEWHMENHHPELSRIVREIKADQAAVRELFEKLDEFYADHPVYTWDQDGNIIEKKCERPGWPNVTHDGLLMYDNRFSTDRAKIIELAKANLTASVELQRDHVKDLQDKLAVAQQWLGRYEAGLAKLTGAEIAKEYPFTVNMGTVDDRVIIGAAECTCEFDRDPDDPPDEEPWHYRRECVYCSKKWWSLHCPHDGVQKPCPHCKRKQPVFLQLEPPAKEKATT
jgi:hypothetical protein